ncbi:DUF2325 domain-containing protein [Dongia sp.]|uniref:DUF2325 domain-containing protein n=1 Tax=Dongia sp. TaxID=1977262 RepID=UPI0035B2CA91
MMTLQILRDPRQGQFTGAPSSRRENLSLGSLFDRNTLPGPIIPAAKPRPRETAQELVEVLRRRAKIWELNASLHCSIIGTCLSTADLRHVLTKSNVVGVEAMTEHDLHKQGVALAGQRDGAAKLLHKALDRKHQRALNHFDAAKAEADLEALWKAAVVAGDIPSAYWALLSHAYVTEKLVKLAFGEVHMLSHLVGAANRADIRRLASLEAKNAGLLTKVARQQEQIHEIASARNAKIQDLTRLLSRRLADGIPAHASAPDEAGQLVTALERRLASETGHRQHVEAKLQAAEAKLAAERDRHAKTQREVECLRRELALVETSLSPEVAAGESEPDSLSGQTILYVGGMSGHVADLRGIAARFGATLLHHDGGLENSGAQLAGFISQANFIFFPVDCISHDAMHLLKRLCRQTGKAYLPLRSAGLTTLLAALRSVPRKQVDAAF